MEKIFELYFTDSIIRLKLISHLYFLLMMTLLTNKILMVFGIHYVPQNITLNALFIFITSGEIVIPIMAFVFCFIMIHYAINGTCKIIAIIFYWTVTRKIFGKDYLIFLLSFLKYIKVENGVIKRGKRTSNFIGIMDDMALQDESTTVKIAEIINACLISTLIVFYSYNINNYFPSWFTIPFVIYSSFYPINMIIIYIYSIRYDEFMEILLSIEDDTNISVKK